MSFIEVNGNKIYYDKYGDGPEVVLLIPGPIGMCGHPTPRCGSLATVLLINRDTGHGLPGVVGWRG